MGPLEGIQAPEPGAKIQYIGNRFYSLGCYLEVSEAFGSMCSNHIAYNLGPVIGERQHSVAVSPAFARQLAFGNDYGIWRSVDGGLSWSGLNEDLPNLP